MSPNENSTGNRPMVVALIRRGWETLQDDNEILEINDKRAEC